MIIDIHSHIGKSLRWPEANIENYIDLMHKENVDIGFLFPVPYQVDLEIKDKVVLNWKCNGKSIEFFSETLDSIVNPYSKINDHFRSIVENYYGDKKLFFIPMIHPILDTSEYLYNYYELHKPMALKIHGVGLGIIPSRISQEMINTLKNLNIPLILHVDYEVPPENYVKEQNTADIWAEWIASNQLKGCIAHGGRLQKNTLNIVNSYDNLYLGIAPIRRISQNKKRLACLEKIDDEYDYLRFLKKNVDNKKILFDLDFNWNKDLITKKDCFDSTKIVKDVFCDNYDDIFSNNSIRLFSQLKNKL